MGLILKQLFSFIRLLNSETGNLSLAAGLTCGFILGMTPSLSLHSLFLFALMFIFRIQIGAAFVSAFFFKFAAYLLDPLFDELGRMALEMKSFEAFYTTLYNLPLVPYTRFNNSIVMGSGILTFLLSPLIFMISLFVIKKYRSLILKRFKDSKFWKALEATKIYQWYDQYQWKNL